MPSVMYAECLYAECHHAECLYAECRYTECRYPECLGTFVLNLVTCVLRIFTNALKYLAIKSVFLQP